MVFWLIKRMIEKHRQKDLNFLHQNLSLSFSNIRNDITEIHSFIQKHKEQLNYFENRISILENNFNPLPNKDNVIIEKIGKNLTSTQRKFFLAIYEIQNKTKSNVSSLKSLSKLLYPNKNPNSIRSTISEYIKNLETRELIVKRRIGKETYVTITEIGNNLLKQIKESRKKKRKNHKLTLIKYR